MGVFPNNSLGPPAPPAPSPEEQKQLRRQAAQAILSLIPLFVVQGYYNTPDEDDILQHIEEDILDVFGDKYMNKHLVYGILELILVRLVPELLEAGPGELLAERGTGLAKADAIPVVEAEAGGQLQNLLGVEKSLDKSVAVEDLEAGENN